MDSIDRLLWRRSAATTAGKADSELNLDMGIGEEGPRERQTSCTIGSCNSKTFQIVKPQRGLLKWERAACMRFAFEMRLLEFNKNVLLSHKKYLNILFLSLYAMDMPRGQFA